MERCGTIGRQVCNSDIKLTEAKVEFKTDDINTDTSFFEFKHFFHNLEVGDFRN